MFKTIPLFSGSAGNCTYIKYGDDEILIDAGVSCKQIQIALQSIGSDLAKIKGILVTHEHTDHIKGLEMIAKKYCLPIYINKNSLDNIEKESTKIMVSAFADIKNAGDSIDIGGIHADIFKTPHDAYGSVGYRFTFSDGLSLGYATDIGYITKGIASSLFGCDSVILESNHDIAMLKNSNYPYHLKARIMSDKGHLSNTSCAEFLPHLFEHGTKKVVLAHLSEHNNTPVLAYSENLEAIKRAGIDPAEFKLTVAKKSILE